MNKFANINHDRFYKMLISGEPEIQLLAFRMLESFFPKLSKKIKPGIYPDPGIIEWFCEMGFDLKKASVIYAVYKIAKFNTKII